MLFFYKRFQSVLICRYGILSYIFVLFFNKQFMTEKQKSYKSKCVLHQPYNCCTCSQGDLHHWLQHYRWRRQGSTYQNKEFSQVVATQHKCFHFFPVFYFLPFFLLSLWVLSSSCLHVWCFYIIDITSMFVFFFLFVLAIMQHCTETTFKTCILHL